MSGLERGQGCLRGAIGNNAVIGDGKCGKEFDSGRSGSGGGAVQGAAEDYRRGEIPLPHV